MARLADGTILGGYATWDHIIGAGGWMTHSDAADDGTMVVCSDAAGPHIRRPGDTRWTRLMMAGTAISAADMGAPWTDLYNEACYDVAICASDSDTIAWVLDGRVYITRDGGTTVTVASLAQKAGCTANDGLLRQTGKMLAFDPQNGDVLFFGAPDGLHYTIDGGDNWTSISTGTIAAPSERHMIAFDRSSTVSGGRTQGIYVFVTGTGLYRTTNAASSWSTVSGAGTNAAHMQVSEFNGYVHLAGDGTNGNANGSYRRWNGSSWHTPGVSTKAIAISPHNSGHIYVCNAGGGIQVSLDDGTTWSSGFSKNRVSVDIPWHEWTNESYMSNGDLIFDRLNNRLWMHEGIGSWYLDSPPTSAPATVNLIEASKGIENMVSTSLRITPTGTVLYACHDRCGFAIPKAAMDYVYPSVHAITNVGTAEVPTVPSLVHGGDMNCAGDDPEFLVVTTFAPTGTPSTYRGGYSTDEGRSWSWNIGNITDFSGGVGGGNIIAFTTTTWVQLATNNGKLMRTTDGGETWAVCSDVSSSGVIAHTAYFRAPRLLVQDENAPTTTAYVYIPDTGNASVRGIWKTTDAGENWTRIYTTYIRDANDFYATRLTQIGVDDWLACFGDNYVGIKRSTDGMQSWNSITGTDDIFGAVSWGEVHDIAVGKPFAEGEPKTVLALGYRTASPSGNPTSYENYGYWLSVDDCATWKRIANFADGHYTTGCLVGCPLEFGVFYVGLGSQGVLRLKYQDVRAQTAAAVATPKVRLVLGGGDSNSVGRGSFSRDPINDGDMAGVWQWKNNSGFAGYRTFSSDITPLHHPDATVPAADRYGPMEQLGRSLKERYPDDEIVLIPCGTGGTSIATAGETWNPAAGGAATPTQYNYFVDSANTVIAAAEANWPTHEIVFEMVYFDCGANDVASAVTGANFYAALNSIIPTFRTDCPDWASARWVLAGLPYDDALLTNGVPIERAIINTIANQSNVYYVKRIDDTPDDGDIIHANQATNRDLGVRAAVVDTDTTAPVWPGLATYNNTTGYKLEIPFSGDFAVQGSVSGTTKTLDANFEVADIFSATRTLRWLSDGTKAVGTYDPTLVIMGGNRQTLDVPLSVVVGTVGSVSPTTLFTAGEKGVVIDLTDATTLFQDIAGTTPVTAAGQVVGKVLDKSPNANHWTAAADNTTRPTYQIDGDGKPYLQFDGSNDVLLALPLADPTNVVYAGTMGLYAAPQSATKTILSNNSTSSGTPFASMFQCSGTTANVTQSVRNDSSGVPALTSVAALDSTKRIITHRYLPQSVTNGVKARDATARGAGGGTTYSSQTTVGGVQVSSFTRSGLGANSNSPVVNFYNGRVYSFYVIGRDITNMEAANGEDWVNARCRTSALP